MTFEIKSGKRVGIVGKNGSGKSTLLRTLGGIYTPTAGKLIVDGTTSTLFNINLGTQKDATGRENIIIRGIIQGLSRKQIRRQMDSIIEFSELGDFIDFPLRTYSAGMNMRLSFAIATSFDHEILLLDEWIGAGDADFQKKASAKMTELVDNAGIAVIASHNKSLLQNVCDTAIWLHDGKLLAYGPVDDVYQEMESAQKRGPDEEPSA